MLNFQWTVSASWAPNQRLEKMESKMFQVMFKKAFVWGIRGINSDDFSYLIHKI